MHVRSVIIFANVLGLLMSQIRFAHGIYERRVFHQELERLKEQYGLMPMA